MCVCDVDEKGCPTDIIQQPLLDANVELISESSALYPLSKQDILVKVQLGQVNIVLSRVLLYSLFRFIAPSESMKKLMKKAAQKADQKAKELKEQTDALVAAPPKPIPSNWERRSVVVSLGMKGATIMMDSEEGGLIMSAGISTIRAEVAICAAKLSVYFNIHDASVLDLTNGCGLYPEVVAISHKDGVDSAKNDFLDAGIVLFNDDRWERYPGYSIEANLSIGAPILTIRMRFINEVLNYIMDGPIMDGLALLSNPDEAMPQSEEEVITEEVIEEEEEPIDTQIMENIKDCAKTIGLQEIGPRFELRPYQIRLGTVDQDEAENEWILHQYTNSSKRRKLLSDA